jgi:poly-gamma-glutamate synthesis protein (capsule biosynthesis protein)
MKYKFATQSKHMELLQRLKASVIELTGNHNLDFGPAAYLKTLEWYSKNNMAYFGGGANEGEACRPLVKTLKDGKKIAWIGYNEVCPLGECTDNKTMGAKRYNEQRANFVIDSLKRKAGVSYLIACVQFTETDSYKPTENQIKISKKLIDLGADVVIGSQAHQAQEIAIYHNKPIFFGLGNFLFDQIHRIGVRQAFFLNCYFFKGRIIQFQPVYTFMKQSRQPNIATAEEKSNIQTSIIKSYNFPIQ